MAKKQKRKIQRRVIAKRLIQKGVGKITKKKDFELLTDLTKEKTITTVSKKTGKKSYRKTRLTKKELAKKLGVSDRTLRSYYKYYRMQYGSKEDNKTPIVKPPKEVSQKLRKIAKARNITATRKSESQNLKSEIRKFRYAVSEQSFKRVKSEVQKLGTEYYGILIRVNINFVVKQGSYNEWITIVFPKDEPLVYETFNSFITEEIRQIVEFSGEGTSNDIYKKVVYNNPIISFEIIEIVFDLSTKKFK